MSIEIVGYGDSMVFHQQTIFGPAFNTLRHKMVQDHADCRSGGVEITLQQITAKQYLQIMNARHSPGPSFGKIEQGMIRPILAWTGTIERSVIRFY